MGRSSQGNDFDILKPLSMQRLRLDSGGYDKGGAYWGHGEPIYCIQDAEGGFYYTMRARSRDTVKAAFREEYPDAWFHGERNPRGAGPLEVIVALISPDDSGPPTYSRLTHLDRWQWSRRTAMKHAREFKAQHMRDAWAQPVE